MIAPAHFDEDRLGEFARTVVDVLRAMADNRDLMTNTFGEPAVDLLDATHTPGMLRIDMLADLSGIGLPTDMPLAVVRARGRPDHLLWLFDETKVATTPVDASPEDAAESLGMEALIDGFARWATRGTGPRRGR